MQLLSLWQYVIMTGVGVLYHSNTRNILLLPLLICPTFTTYNYSLYMRSTNIYRTFLIFVSSSSFQPTSIITSPVPKNLAISTDMRPAEHMPRALKLVSAISARLLDRLIPSEYSTDSHETPPLRNYQTIPESLRGIVEGSSTSESSDSEVLFKECILSSLRFSGSFLYFMWAKSIFAPTKEAVNNIDAVVSIVISNFRFTSYMFMCILNDTPHKSYRTHQSQQFPGNYINQA